MSIPICLLTPDGVRAAPYKAESLAEAAGYEPSGVYTVGRTYNRVYTLRLNDHLDRLEHSASLVGLSVHLDRPALKSALRSLIEHSDFQDVRFRITIPSDTPDQVYLSIEAYKPVPGEILEGGARCITVDLHRTTPEAKTTGWVKERKTTTETLPTGIYEGILLGQDGALLEGMSSNFYAIMDGVLHTATEGVLGGIAQRTVLEVAPDVLAVDRTPVHLADLPFIEEAFLTSAGRGIVPIIMINQQVISTGQPGPQTLILRDRYNAYTESHLEPL